MDVFIWNCSRFMVVGSGWMFIGEMLMGLVGVFGQCVLLVFSYVLLWVFDALVALLDVFG